MRRRTSLGVVVTIAGLLVASCRSVSDTGGLMMLLRSDMNVGTDFDTVRIEVVAGTELLHDATYTVGLKGYALPATLALVPGEATTSPVLMRVTARQAGKLRVFWQARTVVPGGRVAVLPVGLLWACEGRAVESAAGVVSTCEAGLTCIDGACISSDIDSSTLAPYDPAAGDLSNGGECSNGSRDCLGPQPRICSQGRWSSATAVCNAGTGAVCTNGECALPRACSALFAQVPRPPSGVYRLDPDGPGPARGFDAYCELDPSADGGGWTLLLKVDGNRTTFVYDSPFWTNAATVGEGAPALDATEAKLAGFATMPVVDIRVGMRDAGVTRWIAGPLAAPSLAELFAGPFRPTTFGRNGWSSLVALPSIQTNCNLEGISYSGPSANAVRLGMLFNDENDCASIDSFIGIGLDAANSNGVAAGNVNKKGVPSLVETRVVGYVMIR